MKLSSLKKASNALAGIVRNPRSSLAWAYRSHVLTDRMYVDSTGWYHGGLLRVPLAEVMPSAKSVEICLPAAFDRTFGASITVEEACHLCAIAKCVKAQRVLEIGTFDGNTTLALAANLEGEGKVVTVDLPPDFDVVKDKELLAHSDGFINLSPRDQLGRQYQGHPLSARIQPVFGDSAALDWTTFGGPFEFIFIDGCHSREYVWSDSQNALKVLSTGGAIVWHDYAMFEEVSQVVDRIAREMKNLKVYALEGTRLVVALN